MFPAIRLRCLHSGLVSLRSQQRSPNKAGAFRIDDFLEPKRTTDNIAPVEERVVDSSLSYIPYWDWITARRTEAKRSLLIQVKSEQSADDLLDYCSRNFDGVKSMHFHRNPDNEYFSSFFVVELQNPDAVTAIIRNHAEHDNNNGNGRDSVAIPVSSPFMWFSGTAAPNFTKNNHSAGAVQMFGPQTDVQALGADGELEKRIGQFNTLDEQMTELHRLLKMTPLSTRLRFLACEQVELALSGMFPHARVLPFGSSVNSFGKPDADLDMIIKFKPTTETEVVASRFQFHAKVSPGGGRLQSQRYCDQLYNIVQHFLPGCQDVQNIVFARVPIIKYRQQFLGLECDLTMAMTGYFMSELLYLYGKLDSRVQPLVFTIRRWARGQGLVQEERPTPYFTNFTLTLMTIFFLQSKYGLLPSFSELQRLARDQDKVVCDDGVDCSFVRDISGLQPRLNKHWFTQPHLLFSTDHAESNPLTLTQMLTDFFDFYSHFDFKREAICVVSGESQPKRAVSTSTKVLAKNVSFFLDVTNPLEMDLNVSANVQDHAVAKFKRRCVESLKKMLVLSEAGESQELSTSALTHILVGEGIPRLKLQVSSLGSLAKANEGVQKSFVSNQKRTKSGSTSYDRSNDEKRQQDQLKKKYMRAPKVRQFFKPNA